MLGDSNLQPTKCRYLLYIPEISRSSIQGKDFLIKTCLKGIVPESVTLSQTGDSTRAIIGLYTFVQWKRRHLQKKSQ